MEVKTKANLDSEIFYLDGGNVCSAVVISIKVVFNQENAADHCRVKKQREVWFAFGKDGVWYKTIHGVIHESQIFLSREELGKAVADGSLNKDLT